MEALLPQVPAQEPLPELVPAQGARRCRVGLLLGCVSAGLLPHVNAATARVLAAEGCEVAIPADSRGAPAGPSLFTREKRRRPCGSCSPDDRRLRSKKAEVDVVGINAAGRGWNVKEYGSLAARRPVDAVRAEALRQSAATSSNSWPSSSRVPLCHPSRLRVATTTPAHWSTRRDPRAAASVPDEFRDFNCGRSPSRDPLRVRRNYNMVQPEAATQLGDRKAGHVLALDADWSCPEIPAACSSSRLPSARRPKIAGSPSIELLDALIREVSL